VGSTRVGWETEKAKKNPIARERGSNVETEQGRGKKCDALNRKRARAGAAPLRHEGSSQLLGGKRTGYVPKRREARWSRSDCPKRILSAKRAKPGPCKPERRGSVATIERGTIGKGRGEGFPPATLWAKRAIKGSRNTFVKLGTSGEPGVGGGCVYPSSPQDDWELGGQGVFPR